jgi:hypothetical protein
MAKMCLEKQPHFCNLQLEVKRAVWLKAATTCGKTMVRPSKKAYIKQQLQLQLQL